MDIYKNPLLDSYSSKSSNFKNKVKIAPIVLGVLVSLVFFIVKYHYESSIIILACVFITYSFVLINKISILQFCLIFLPFNTSMSVFGSSVMLYCLLIGLTHIVITKGFNSVFRINLDFTFWLMLFLVFVGIKNIVAYSYFRDFTFIVSIILLSTIIKSEVKHNTIGDELLPYGIVLISFGLLQLITGDGVSLRYIGRTLSFQLKGTYEPNYYTLYLNVFLSILLFTELSIAKVFRLMLIFLTTGLIIMVKSNTGMLVLIGIYVLKMFSSVSRKTLKKVMKILIVMIFLSVIVISAYDIIIVRLSSLRLINTLNAFIESGDVNSFSTGRVGIWSQYLTYFNNQAPIEKLIGSSLSVFTRRYGVVKATHNFWIDVLIEVGVIGIIFYLLALTKLYVGFFKNKIKLLSPWFGLSILMIFALYSMSLALYSERTSWAMAILLYCSSLRGNPDIRRYY